jgi:isopenicillin N synthase-like dioxygenase
LIPGFRSIFEQYLNQVQDLSNQFTSLVAESFGLGPEGLAGFYDLPEKTQHWVKIVQYPVTHDGSGQGMGPHYDAGFLTFVREYHNLFDITDHIHESTVITSFAPPRTTSPELIGGMD